jgi:aspartate 1-decarboxylase
MISIVEITPAAEGFTFACHADGSVVISHNGRAATLLRGDSAVLFLAEVAANDQQEVAARWTAKYRPEVVFVPKNYPRARSANHRRHDQSA